MEDSLMEQQDAHYYCPTCQKSYTSLQAMARASKNDKPFRFLCEKCNVDLEPTANIAEVRRESLSSFRTRHQELLLLTRDLAGLTVGVQEMPIPYFPRPKLSKKRASKQESGLMIGEGNQEANPTNAKGPVEQKEASSSSVVPNKASCDSKQDTWFSTEVLDEPHISHVEDVHTYITWST